VRFTLALACCAAVFAQDQTPRATARARTDVGTNVHQGVVDFYDSMADHFKLTSRAVDAIAQKGIPDEEIPAVLWIARHSSASPNQVIEARKSGKSFADIAQANNVKMPGNDLVTEANVAFLSAYHARKPEEIRALHQKGASFIDINQQYRRVGMKPQTEKSASQ